MDGQIFEVWAAGGAGYGSGYLVGPRHVLTALHVVADGVPGTDKRFFGDHPWPVQLRADIKVRSAKGGVWCEARVVWPSARDARYDVALVEVAAPLGHSATRWGRLVTRSAQVPCEIAGFPRAQRYAAGSAGDAVRDIEHMAGSITAGTGHKAGYVFIGPKYDLGDGWSGMSGAAVLCNSLVTAVLIAGSSTGGRLVAQPVDVLMAEQSFREALGLGPQVLEPAELACPVLAHRTITGGLSPAWLLRPDVNAVRFHGRRLELDRLLGWCGDGFPVHLLTGPGGQGKTRLAQELINHLGNEWACTFLDDTELSDLSTFKSLLNRVATPTLLVIDRAEARRRNTLEGLVSAAMSSDHDAPLKLLLIARSAGHWWKEVGRKAGGLSELLEPVQQLMLDPVEDTAEGRQLLFDEAWQDLACRLETAQPGWRRPVRPTAPENLEHERYGSALMLLMEALAWLLEPERTPSDRSAEEVILDREELYWVRAAESADVDLVDDTLRLVVAAAALYGSGSLTQGGAAEWLASLPGMGGLGNDQARRTANWLRDLYPAPGGHQPAGSYWGLLQPERLAEYLIADQLRGGTELLTAFSTQCSAEQAGHALSILAEIGRRHPDVNIELGAIVRMNPKHAPQAVRVVAATENPNPLLEGLFHIDRSVLSVAELTELSQAIPTQSSRLAHFGVEVQLDLVRAHQTSATDSPADAAHQRQLARSLGDYAIRLEDVGRLGQALESTRQAVSILEGLAADEPALRAELAHIRVTMSGLLSATGYLEAAALCAQQAFRLFASLKQADLPFRGLVEALGTMGLRLIEAQRYDEAVEALRLVTTAYDQLAEQLSYPTTPDSADDDDLILDKRRTAKWHNNLAAACHHTGNYEEALTHARKSVSIRRELVKKKRDPDRISLGNSLLTLAAVQDTMGDDQAAQSDIEALEIFEEAARSNPAAYLSMYVGCIRTLLGVSTQSEIGTSLGLMVSLPLRARELYAYLRESKPWIYLPKLALIVPGVGPIGETGLSIVVDRGTGEPQNLQQADEAVTIYRKLRHLHRAFYEPLLQAALIWKMRYLDADDCDIEALSALQETAAIQRVLAKTSQEASQYLLSMLYGIRDRMLKLQEGPNLITSVTAEAVAVARRLEGDQTESQVSLACALFNHFEMIRLSENIVPDHPDIMKFAELCSWLRNDLDDAMRFPFATKLWQLAKTLDSRGEALQANYLRATAFRLRGK